MQSWKKKASLLKKYLKLQNQQELKSWDWEQLKVFAGLSEKWISPITWKKLCYKVHNTRFKKKARPCPVQAKHGQSQHQVDLVVMKKCKSKWKGKHCKFILSVMDVFSRYHWQEPFKIKSFGAVAYSLK